MMQEMFLKICFEGSYGYKLVKKQKKGEVKIKGRNWN